MPHDLYDVNKRYEEYNQEGEGSHVVLPRFQRGYGPHRMPQKGRGVVGVARKVWQNALKPLFVKYVAPLAKDALQALTSEGLDAGQKVLTDLSKGENLRESLASAGTQAAKNIMKRAGSRLLQEGSGRRKARSRSTLRLVGQSVLESSANKRGRRKNNLGLF